MRYRFIPIIDPAPFFVFNSHLHYAKGYLKLSVSLILPVTKVNILLFDYLQGCGERNEPIEESLLFKNHAVQLLGFTSLIPQ